MSKPACPICGKPVEPPAQPFCSLRCSRIDLGRWLTEGYVIPAEPVAPEAPEEMD